MALKENIPTSLYPESPTLQEFGDTVSPDERLRADQRALGELALSQTLAELNSALLAADSPMPALAMRLSTVRGDKRLAQTYLAYGQTEPRQGLQPTKEVERANGPGYSYRARPGLAVPINLNSRGSVNYWPAWSWSQAEGSRLVGSWSQLQPDRYTTHNPHLGSEVTYYDEEITFASQSFTVWPTGFGRFHEGAPNVITAARRARQETRSAITIVSNANARGNGVATIRQGDAWHHTIFIGAPAVEGALGILGSQRPGSPNVPQPFSDMLDAVANGLSVAV